MDYAGFSVNQRFTFGRYTVTRDQIVVCCQYDPQAFRTDESHPRTTELGGIMAVAFYCCDFYAPRVDVPW